MRLAVHIRICCGRGGGGGGGMDFSPFPTFLLFCCCVDSVFAPPISQTNELILWLSSACAQA